MIGKIDKLGRIVLPKKLRDRLGFVAGEPVDVVEADGSIRISLHRTEPRLEWKDGILVVNVGESGVDIVEMVRTDRLDREERILKQR